MWSVGVKTSRKKTLGKISAHGKEYKEHLKIASSKVTLWKKWGERNRIR